MSCRVVDTGPLIFLAKLNRLNLLQQGADEVLIPAAVLNEVQVLDDEASRRIDLATQTWLQMKEVDNQQALEILLADLDSGEAEVIALAREVKADWVIMDDLDARRFARRVGLSPVGTLGLLLAARLRGELPSLKNEIERLHQFGFWASESLIEAVLTAADE
jgi:predicted nucleic acid-binding protein